MANAGRSDEATQQIWYHWNTWKQEIEERKVLSHSAEFITPVPIPTEWDKHPKPRRERKDGEWFATRQEVVEAIIAILTRRAQEAADEYSRATQRLQEFRKKENLR